MLDYDDLLLYWAQMAAEPEIAAHLGQRFDHVLVDEYQDTNRLQASILTGAEAGRIRADGGRRRRAVDLFVPRRRGAQHPRFPQAVRAGRRDRHARAQLSLDRNHPGRRQCGDRRGVGALHQEPLVRAQIGGASRSWSASATRSSRRTTSARRSWPSARPARR